MLNDDDTRDYSDSDNAVSVRSGSLSSGKQLSSGPGLSSDGRFEVRTWLQILRLEPVSAIDLQLSGKFPRLHPKKGLQQLLASLFGPGGALSAAALSHSLLDIVVAYAVPPTLTVFLRATPCYGTSFRFDVLELMEEKTRDYLLANKVQLRPTRG